MPKMDNGVVMKEKYANNAVTCMSPFYRVISLTFHPAAVREHSGGTAVGGLEACIAYRPPTRL